MRFSTTPDTAEAVVQQWATDVAAQVGDCAGIVLRHVRGEQDPSLHGEAWARLAFYRHLTHHHVP